MEATPTVGKLNATRRTETGKGTAHKLRAAGKVPAVCYGNGEEAIPLTIIPEELRAALDPDKGENTLIELTILGDGDPEVVQVLVTDFQLHAIKQHLMHADFLKVDMNKQLRVQVPLVLVGKSAGVLVGGVLHQIMRELPMYSLPDRIPTNVELDISKLEIGDGLRVSDLDLGEGITIDLPGTQAVVAIAAPKAAEEEATVGEEGEEGEEGAEGEEGEDGEKKKAEGEDDKKGDK